MPALPSVHSDDTSSSSQHLKPPCTPISQILGPFPLSCVNRDSGPSERTINNWLGYCAVVMYSQVNDYIKFGYQQAIHILHFIASTKVWSALCFYGLNSIPRQHDLCCTEMHHWRGTRQASHFPFAQTLEAYSSRKNSTFQPPNRFRFICFPPMVVVHDFRHCFIMMVLDIFSLLIKQIIGLVQTLF